MAAVNFHQSANKENVIGENPTIGPLPSLKRRGSIMKSPATLLDDVGGKSPNKRRKQRQSMGGDRRVSFGGFNVRVFEKDEQSPVQPEPIHQAPLVLAAAVKANNRSGLPAIPDTSPSKITVSTSSIPVAIPERQMPASPYSLRARSVSVAITSPARSPGRARLNSHNNSSPARTSIGATGVTVQHGATEFIFHPLVDSPMPVVDATMKPYRFEDENEEDSFSEAAYRHLLSDIGNSEANEQKQTSVLAALVTEDITMAFPKVSMSENAFLGLSSASPVLMLESSPNSAFDASDQAIYAMQPIRYTAPLVADLRALVDSDPTLELERVVPSALQSLLDDDVTMTLAALTSSSNIHVADAVSVINEKSEFAVQTLQSLVEDDQTISTPNFQIIDDQPIVYSALDIESNGITPIIGSNNDFIANDNVSMSMTAALWNPILVRAEEQTEVDVVAAHIDHPVWLPSISAQLTSFESQPVHQMTCVRPQPRRSAVSFTTAEVMSAQDSILTTSTVFRAPVSFVQDSILSSLVDEDHTLCVPVIPKLPKSAILRRRSSLGLYSADVDMEEEEDLQSGIFHEKNETSTLSSLVSDDPTIIIPLPAAPNVVVNETVSSMNFTPEIVFESAPEESLDTLEISMEQESDLSIRSDSSAESPVVPSLSRGPSLLVSHSAWQEDQQARQCAAASSPVHQSVAMNLAAVTKHPSSVAHTSPVVQPVPSVIVIQHQSTLTTAVTCTPVPSHFNNGINVVSLQKSPAHVVASSPYTTMLSTYQTLKLQQSCDQTQSAARRVQLASITSASLAQATVQPLDYYDHTGHSGAEVTQVAVGVLDMDRDTSVTCLRPQQLMSQMQDGGVSMTGAIPLANSDEMLSFSMHGSSILSDRTSLVGRSQAPIQWTHPSIQADASSISLMPMIDVNTIAPLSNMVPMVQCELTIGTTATTDLKSKMMQAEFARILYGDSNGGELTRSMGNCTQTMNLDQMSEETRALVMTQAEILMQQDGVPEVNLLQRLKNLKPAKRNSNSRLSILALAEQDQQDDYADLAETEPCVNTFNVIAECVSDIRSVDSESNSRVAVGFVTPANEDVRVDGSEKLSHEPLAEFMRAFGLSLREPVTVSCSRKSSVNGFVQHDKAMSGQLRLEEEMLMSCLQQVELDQYESAVYDLQQRIDQLKPSVSDTIMVLSEQPAPLMKMFAMLPSDPTDPQTQMFYALVQQHLTRCQLDSHYQWLEFKSAFETRMRDALAVQHSQCHGDFDQAQAVLSSAQQTIDAAKNAMIRAVCTDVQNVSSISPTSVNDQSVTSSLVSDIRDIAMLEHCEVQLVEWTAREQRARAEEAGRAELANAVQDLQDDIGLLDRLSEWSLPEPSVSVQCTMGSNIFDFHSVARLHWTATTQTFRLQINTATSARLYPTIPVSFIESLLAQLSLTTLCNRFVSGQSEPAPFLMQAIELAYGRVFDLLDELQSLAHQHRFTLAFCESSYSRNVHLSGLPTVTITICSPAAVFAVPKSMVRLEMGLSSFVHTSVATAKLPFDCSVIGAAFGTPDLSESAVSALMAESSSDERITVACRQLRARLHQA